MNARDIESLEKSLSGAARAFPYPPTPPIAAAVMLRLDRRLRRRTFTGRWAWTAVAVLVVLATLMLVPPARAAILDFIQIGVVRIFRNSAPPPAPVPTTGLSTPAIQAPLTATPAVHIAPTATATPALLDLAGETTLSEAQAKVGFAILLPAYPADLGEPDHVYLQNPGNSMLILVWLDRADPPHIRMSLHEIAPGSWAIDKYDPLVIRGVRVNGRQAAWAVGPYMIEARNGEYVERRLITGHVLIWEQGDVTYRLETDLPLEEAIKIAESLKAAP